MTTVAAEPKPKPNGEESRFTQDQLDRFIATGRLMHELARDPKHRPQILRLVKAGDPEAVIPELEFESLIDTRLETHLKPLKDENKALRSELDVLKSGRNRDLWRMRTGLSEEEMVEIDELAKGKITDPEVAVEFWRMKNALGTPRGTRRPSAASTEYLEELGKINPRNAPRLKAAAMREAERVIREVRGH